MKYDNPKRPCDLVLKGGTTSGVLYPSAICRFAEDYEIVSLGGTSAGALASAIAAAAEFRRRHGDTAGYEELEKLPAELSQEGRLKALFTPEKPTEKLFELLESFLQKRGKALKLRLAWLTITGRLKVWERAWSENGMGCCTGMANDGLSGDAISEGWQSITPWLSHYIDRVSGVEGRIGNCPLTIGDLHNAPQPKTLNGSGIHLKRSVDPRFITTNLTFGSPIEIPFENKIYGFRLSEWRRLFPAYVIRHMEKHQYGTKIFDEYEDVVALPLEEEFPVIVAARMSMSLPGVFTAIPLVAIDYEDQPDAGGDSSGSEASEPKRKNGILRDVWFSDGGITSNLPIHRFDSLFPRWPTLAVNLQYAKEKGEYGRRNVRNNLYLPKQRNHGSNRLMQGVSKLEYEIPYDGIKQFLGSILSTALRWHDNSYLVLPGYRGRVVEIWLEPDEGGENWNMPPETVERLVKRGRTAADLLARRMLAPENGQAYSWNDQRWRRFRAVMAGMSKWLEGFEKASQSTRNGNQKLDTLLAKPPCHPVPPGDQAKAKSAIRALVEFSRAAQDEAWLDDKRPKPDVEVGTRPPMGGES